MTTQKTVLFYRKLRTNDFRVYNSTIGKFETMEQLPYGKNMHIYYAFKDYDTDEQLKQFYLDFEKWCDELLEFDIDYRKFKTHAGAIPLLVKNHCKHFDEFEEIDMIEASYIEKCKTNGLQILRKKGERECFGYDFKAFYLSMLGKPNTNLDIPFKKGRECILETLNFYRLELGYYRVNITSSDPKFIFNFNAENVYTNIELYDAFKEQHKGLDIKITLIQDGKPNAYLYGTNTKTGVRSARYMFNKLYDKMMLAKNKYPKNKLVKFICSSIWGHVCEFNSKNLTMKQIQEQDIYVTPDLNDKEADYYIHDYNGKYLELVNMKKPFKYECARLKPFLLAYGRVIASNIGRMHIDDLVRIHTDGIVFSRQHDDVMSAYKSYPELLPENKTSGIIDWKGCNDYYNKTVDEFHGHYKKETETKTKTKTKK